MRLLLIILACMVLGTSCGNKGTQSAGGNTPSTAPITSSCNLFKLSDSYEEIALKAHKMEAECGLDEAQVLALLKDPGI